MSERPSARSEEITPQQKADISNLAREFEIDPDVLAADLEDAAQLLCFSRENVRTADKKALRGVATALVRSVDCVSDRAVRQRLIVAAVREPDRPDKDGLAHYAAWCAAQSRVNAAIEGARDLLDLVRAAEAFRARSGRPGYEHWTVAVASLLYVWIEDLGREFTISGHDNDSRGVRPSPTLRFVHQCMRLLGEDITEQACRTILQSLRDRKAPRGVRSL